MLTKTLFSEILLIRLWCAATAIPFHQAQLLRLLFSGKLDAYTNSPIDGFSRARRVKMAKLPDSNDWKNGTGVASYVVLHHRPYVADACLHLAVCVPLSSSCLMLLRYASAPVTLSLHGMFCTSSPPYST